MNCDSWPGAVKLDAAPPPGPVTPCRSMLCGILLSGMVLQVELDRVALAHADEAAGHGAAESPERVGHALGDLLVDLVTSRSTMTFAGCLRFDRRAAPRAGW